ncbi:MAG: hypothetical protein ACREA4_04420 [Nitrososphaera sp.]
MSEKGDWIRLLVKYKGKCAECGKEIPQGEYALWSRTSKAIKHVKCESAESSDSKTNAQVLDLECYICGKSAECMDCGFEADCNRAQVSQACICNQCLSDKEAFENYKQTFLVKMRRIAKGSGI